MSKFIGSEYFCQLCKNIFIINEEMIDDLELSHDNGEHLSITTVCCPSCESMSLPEGMNQIAWLMPNKIDEEK